jgi:phosphoribosyl 1,2-cyclic phosphodiesterase
MLGYGRIRRSKFGLGHLANHVSAQILAELLHDKLQHLVAAHLSERNNRPDVVRAALSAACGVEPQDIVIADPKAGFEWLQIA